MATQTNKTFSKGGTKVVTKTTNVKEPVAPIPAQPIVKAQPPVQATANIAAANIATTPEETAKKEPVAKLKGTTEANTVRSATFSNGKVTMNYEK